MTTANEALLPCPWCLQEPKATNAGKVLLAVCVTEGCTLNGFLFGRDKWNTRAYLALQSAPRAVPEREPTEEMLNAARDWSLRVNGIGVGNDQATGCWRAMYDAAPKAAHEGLRNRVWAALEQFSSGGFTRAEQVDAVMGAIDAAPEAPLPGQSAADE